MRLVGLQMLDQGGSVGISGAGVAGGRKLFAYENDVAQTAFLQIIHYFLMLFGTVFAQLAHVAQDEHFVVGLHLVEVADGGAHAGGVGVVGIDDEGVVGRLLQLRAVVLRHVLLQGLVYLGRLNAEEASYGDGGQCVGKVVFADEVGLHFVALAVFSGFPGEGQVGRVAGHLSVDVQTAVGAVIDGVQAPGHFAQVGIVVMDEDGRVAVAAQEVEEFAFGTHHSLERAEAFQMGLAHVGDESVVGFGDVHQFLDVAGVAGSHFYDGQFVLGAQAQQGEGHADVVVQVAFGVEYVVALRQHGGQQFLGRSLAVGAGDADDARAHLPAVVVGQLLQGFQTVVHEEVAVVSLRSVLGFVDHGVSASGFERAGGKSISVERFAFQGDEE